MSFIVRALVFLLFGLQFNPAQASDACEDRAIRTSASVKVSDGSAFDIESFFQSKDFSAIHFLMDRPRVIAVEGPFSWVSEGRKKQIGGEALRRYALGQQFHALIIRFEDIVSDIKPKKNVMFDGEERQGRGGKYPHGGEITLIQGSDETRPLGLLLELPNTAPMQIKFSDWRKQEGAHLPFQVQVEDDESVFEYTYNRIDITRETPLWYFDAVKAPKIEHLKIYRLHRLMLAAHCIGDVDLMADLSAPKVTVSSQGELQKLSKKSMRANFTQRFEKLDYLHYEDIVRPVIEVSERKDMGWIAVNVRARGKVISGSQTFDDQWSWVMMVKKVNGQWLNAGIASNRMP